MKADLKILKMGPCSFCDKRIVEKGKPNEFYREFFVKFDDGSNAAFAVCSDCYENLDRGKVEELVRNQIYSWGNEVQKQLTWFISKASQLRLDTFAKTKDEL